MSACEDCPAGFFCPPKTSNHTLHICPQGHYCPEGTQSGTEKKCKPGTFNPDFGSHNESSCLPCTEGFYCQGSGNSNVTDQCEEGWYCPTGSDDPRKEECQAGTFCPKGSPAPTPCTASKYCSTARLSAPDGICDPGYYCPNGSTTGSQESCPAGHYCERGSGIPTPCQPGTFNPDVLQDDISACRNCTPGKYCNGSGLTKDDGDCDKGYYCPGGQSIPNPSKYQCKRGHYCKAGSYESTLCESGTYQENVGKDSCDECPQGYYCDNTENRCNDTDKSYLVRQICITGHYCPKGTKQARENGCPQGTWSNRTGLNSSDECYACISG